MSFNKALNDEEVFSEMRKMVWHANASLLGKSDRLRRLRGQYSRNCAERAICLAIIESLGRVH